MATFYDGIGIDVAELSPFEGRMTGSGFNNVALQFPRINAFSRFSQDTVTLNGSSGIDTFTGQESSSSLVGSNYGLFAFRFRNTIAKSNGGNDLASCTTRLPTINSNRPHNLLRWSLLLTH